MAAALAAVFAAAALLAGAADARAAGDASVAFIRASCARTLYPPLCISSLAGFAGEVQSDPVRLALAAANVTAASLRGVSARASELRAMAAAATPARKGRGSTTEALNECASVVRSALGLAQQSEARLAELETATGLDVGWCVDDVRTWLSAAMTDEETCEDDLSGGAGFVGGAAATAVQLCAMVRKAKQHTSNALALVNMLVNG